MSSRPPAAGDLIGRYRIEDALGSGGMGVVWIARDELLHRRVALKVLPADRLADPQARQRLLREARAAASLDHPNVCAVFDAGEDGPYIFIAMQLIEGTTLGETMSRERLEISRCLEIAADIASALAEAHRREIVHRDLKPGNVMLTSRGAKILDFGLAHMLDSDADSITREGEITGTIPYMAPEQIRGEPAGPAGDVFSLGVLLYEMIAGRRPFRGPNAAAIMHAIVNEPVPPLPSVAESLRPVESLLGEMMSRDPETRPAADLVCTRLRDFVDNMDFSTDVPTAVTKLEPGEPRSESRTSSGRWGSDSALVSQSIDPEVRRLYLRGRHLWNKRTPPAVKESITLFQQAIDLEPLFPEAYVGIADSSMYLSYLDFVSPRIVISRARAAAARALELDASISQAHATLGWVAVIYDWNWERASEEFERAIELDEGNATAHHWYGIALSIRGELDDATRHVQRAFELESLSPIMAIGLSLPHYYDGEFREAVRICREIVESDPSFPAARFYLGRSLEAAGDIEGAVRCYREMIELLDVEMEHVAALGGCLAMMGDHSGAAEIETRLQEASQRRYITPFYFALIASGRRDRDATLSFLERAIEEHATRVAELHVDPRFAWLHDDAAFRALVETVGFAPLRKFD